MTALQSGKARPKRRWFRIQFSVRGVLIATALIAVCLAIATRGVVPANFDAAYRQYITHEGHNKRGKLFAQLALSMGPGAADGWRFSERDVLRYLGPPDRVVEDGQRKTFAYFYDQAGDKDWVIDLFMRSGVVETVGFNDRSVNDYSAWTAFQPARVTTRTRVTSFLHSSALPRVLTRFAILFTVAFACWRCTARFVRKKRSRQRMAPAWLVATLLSWFACYIVSVGPVYCLTDRAGLIQGGPDGAAVILGVVYSPLWILSYVPPLGSLLHWYWGLWMPPLQA